MRKELRRRLTASQEAIESFCWDFQQWLGDEVSARDAFATELLLREALVNAVEHGCGKAAESAVDCVIRHERGAMLIAVKDSGPGFDWRSRWELQPEAEACSGRGVLIYRTYANRVRFNRAGNSVLLWRRLEASTSQEKR